MPGCTICNTTKKPYNLWTGNNFSIKIVIRMKKRFFLAVLALIWAVSTSLVTSLAAQEREFPPHVSQIKAEPRNNLIRLTWVDSPDVKGPVYIFRSTRPFGESIPPNIRPVIVRYGDQYYMDDADDLENLYYFIAASDTSGRRYDVIIPQINSTGTDSEAPVTQIPPVRAAFEPIQGISNLQANQDGDKVIITFDVTDANKNAVLYRSMQPVRQPQDLLNAIIVKSEIVSPFVDFPVPGITWYYTAVYEDEISGGKMGIRPGINATTSAVIISGDEVTQALRPLPLPFMTLRNAMPDGYFLPGAADIIPMSEETANMLKNIRIPSKAPLTPKTPRVFTVDLQSPSSGEESALFQIVKEFFEKRDWEGARTSLLHYLSLPRSKDVEARARFYLGQALYFTGNYREALFEFLSIRSVHTVEANIWIEAVLTAMVY